MKKLLYVTFVDFDDTRFGGVMNKIKNQIHVFESAGYPVTLVTRFGSGVAVYSGGERRVIKSDIGVFSRKVLTTAAYAEATKGGYGYLYMRFQFFCGNVKKMLERLKALNIYNVVEIPTFPYDNELRMQGLRGYPKLLCDSFYRTSCSKSIDLYTTYSHDTGIYGCKAIPLSNGILVDSVPVSASGYSSDRLDIISMSSMLPWHGIDRAITGLGEYYEKGGSCNIHLHICGEGSELENYKAIVRRYGLDTHVTFYGPTYGEQLSEVFDRCTVGLCALGVHRRGDLNGSPLKTVEYVARGIAVISEMKLDFLPEGNDYLYTVPPDESPLDFAAIVAWHNRLMVPGASEVHDAIRQYAYEHCDMSVTMGKVIENFGSR